MRTQTTPLDYNPSPPASTGSLCAKGRIREVGLPALRAAHAETESSRLGETTGGVAVRVSLVWRKHVGCETEAEFVRERPALYLDLMLRTCVG